MGVGLRRDASIGPGRRPAHPRGRCAADQRRSGVARRALALLVGLLGDDDDAVVLTAAHAPAGIAVGAHPQRRDQRPDQPSSPEVRRRAGELVARSASNRPSDDGLGRWTDAHPDSASSPDARGCPHFSSPPVESARRIASRTLASWSAVKFSAGIRSGRHPVATFRSQPATRHRHCVCGTTGSADSRPAATSLDRVVIHAIYSCIPAQRPTADPHVVGTGPMVPAPPMRPSLRRGRRASGHRESCDRSQPLCPCVSWRREPAIRRASHADAHDDRVGRRLRRPGGGPPAGRRSCRRGRARTR